MPLPLLAAGALAARLLAPVAAKQVVKKAAVSRPVRHVAVNTKSYAVATTGASSLKGFGGLTGPSPTSPTPGGTPRSPGGALNTGGSISTSTVSGSGAGTSAADQQAASEAAYNNYLNQAFETQFAGFQSALDALPQHEQIARLGVQRGYQGNKNKLDLGKEQGMRNLNFADEQVDEQRAKGLASIADQIRQQSMGYNNQLGAYGAGNSSASGMINFALAQQGAKNRGSIMDEASNQERQIGMQRQDLETEYAMESENLENWRQQQMYELAQSFANKQLEIRQAMAGAQGERARLLGQQNQALVQQAVDALRGIQDMHKQASANLVGKYESLSAPGFDIDPRLQQFDVNPIDAGRVAQIPTSPLNNNAAFDPIQQILRRRLDETTGEYSTIGL